MGEVFMPKKKTLSKKPSTAVHLKSKDGIHHFVGFGNLRVAIVPDGDLWFAQALEVDYCAQGTSPKHARKEFSEGLSATIKEHLRVHGSISRLLKLAPQQVWDDVSYSCNTIPNEYSTFCTYHVEREEVPSDLQKFLPFNSIVFMHPGSESTQ